jgi:hypothetical protein
MENEPPASKTSRWRFGFLDGLLDTRAKPGDPNRQCGELLGFRWCFYTVARYYVRAVVMSQFA